MEQKYSPLAGGVNRNVLVMGKSQILSHLPYSETSGIKSQIPILNRENDQLGNQPVLPVILSFS